MDSIHHYSVIAIKFTVSPMFPYLGCTAFLHLSIINQGKISPSRGSYVVYLGHTSGPTILCLRYLCWNRPCAWWSPVYTLLNFLDCVQYGSRYGARTNMVGETIEFSHSQSYTHTAHLCTHRLAQRCTQPCIHAQKQTHWHTQDPGRRVEPLQGLGYYWLG